MQAFFSRNFSSRHRGQQHGFAPQSTTEIEPDNGAIHLGKHQHLRLNDACGWRVHATAGTVWITQDGELRDVVLEAGQSFVMDRAGTALLSPLNDAHVSLERGSCPQTAQSRTSKKTGPPFTMPAARIVSV